MTLFYDGFTTASTIAGLTNFDIFTATTQDQGFDTNSAGYAVTDNTSTSLAFPKGVTFTDDQFCQVTLVNNLGASTGLALRETPAGSNADSAGYIARSNGTNWIIAAQVAAGTTTTLGTATKARVAGDVVRFVALGTVLSLYVNDFTTPIITYDTVNDAVKYTSGRAGMRAAGTVGVQLDDFYSGNYSDLAAMNAGPTITLGTSTTTTQPLAWSPYTGATSYLVEYRLNGVSAWTTFASAVTGTSTTVTGLNSGALYDYRVTPNPSGPASAVKSASTVAPGSTSETVNSSPASGVPDFKGVVWGPSGKLILPGKPLHRFTVRGFGAAGAFTPPENFAVPDGAATLTSGLCLLQLSTAASAAARATLALTPEIDLASYSAIKIDVEAMSFSAASPAVILRIGAVGTSDASIGGGLIQSSSSATEAVRLHSGGEGSTTRGVFSHLGATATQRRQTSVLIVPAAKEVYLLEDDELLLWRRDVNFKTGSARVRLQIENLAATAVNLRLARLDVTLYA